MKRIIALMAVLAVMALVGASIASAHYTPPAPSTVTISTQIAGQSASTEQNSGAVAVANVSGGGGDHHWNSNSSGGGTATSTAVSGNFSQTFQGILQMQ